MKPTTIRQWLVENYEQYPTRVELIRACKSELHYGKRAIQKVYEDLFKVPDEGADPGQPNIPIDSKEDLIRGAAKVAAHAQKIADVNRIERASFRKAARHLNAHEELLKDLLDLLGSNTFSTTPAKVLAPVIADPSVGIIHLTDLHFDKCIDTVGIPSFDFHVASRRLMSLVNRSLFNFKANGVKKVLIAFTGDIMTSDRRIDEMLTNASARSVALFTAVEILQQVILHVSKSYPVSVLSVVGNEGRIQKDMDYSDRSAIDSYDWLIHQMLARMLASNSRIQFFNGGLTEQLVKICGKNILFMHGLAQSAKCSEETFVGQVVSRYAAKGILVDYVIFGHLHTPHIGFQGSRSGSLCGACPFAEFKLNVTSGASQNIFVITSDRIDGSCMDLEKPGDREYPFQDSSKLLNSLPAVLEV